MEEARSRKRELTYGDSQKISDCTGTGVGSGGEEGHRRARGSLGERETFQILIVPTVSRGVHMPKLAKLSNLNARILLYVNYNSRKLF